VPSRRTGRNGRSAVSRLERGTVAPYSLLRLPTRKADLTPGGRYSVRASVRQGGRLLFTTDTISPVLKGGATNH